MNKRQVLAAVLAAGLLAPTTGSAFAAGTEAAVAPEVSPPGDIPDNQAFILFKSPAGFSVKVPEGWARKDSGSQTVFSDKYNHIAIAVMNAVTPLDVAYANSKLAQDTEKSGRAVSITKVSEVKLKGGTAIKIAFDSNSQPSPVTNKQVREENERFYFAKGGKLVSLQLSAPKGADNVDQWKLISSSFRWN